MAVENKPFLMYLLF